MPVALIEVRRDYGAVEAQALIDALHAAMVCALEIPEDDRIVRLLVHAPAFFACPPGKAHPERFTLIGVDLFAGRSPAAKRRLYAAIFENLAPLGIPADHIVVRLNEIPRENWGLRGQPASEVDLGFKVEV